MVTSLIVSLSDGTRGGSFWDCHRAKGWGKETGRESPSQRWVGSTRGQRCLSGSAVVWGPSCGAVALHIQGQDSLPFGTGLTGFY